MPTPTDKGSQAERAWTGCGKCQCHPVEERGRWQRAGRLSQQHRDDQRTWCTWYALGFCGGETCPDSREWELAKELGCLFDFCPNPNPNPIQGTRLLSLRQRPLRERGTRAFTPCERARAEARLQECKPTVETEARLGPVTQRHATSRSRSKDLAPHLPHSSRPRRAASSLGGTAAPGRPPRQAPLAGWHFVREPAPPRVAGGPS